MGNMTSIEIFLLAAILMSRVIVPVYLMSRYVPATSNDVPWKTWLHKTPHTQILEKPDMACALQCELQHDITGGRDWCNTFRISNTSDKCELSSLRPEALSMADTTDIDEEILYYSPSRKHAGKAFFSFINGHQLALFTEGGKVPCVVSPDVIPEFPGEYVTNSRHYIGFTSKTRTIIVCGGFVGPPGTTRYYTEKCYFIQLNNEVPSWNDSLSLPYKWNSGASVSTGSRVFFWGGGLAPREDPVLIFDSRALTIKTLLGEDGSPIQALHDTSRNNCAMALDEENIFLVVGVNARETYRRVFHLHVGEDLESNYPLIKELPQLEFTRKLPTCGVVEWLGRKVLMVGGSKNGSSSPINTMEIMDAMDLDFWTTLTIPYPHDPFYRLTNMGSHGRVAMMTKNRINFLNPDTMTWEEDPEVQLGGIFSPYTIEVVDQQHFPSCFIDNSP